MFAFDPKRRLFLEKSAAALVCTACGSSSPSAYTPVPSPTPLPKYYDMLVGAGDIGCSQGPQLTAGLIQGILDREPYGQVFTLGDNTQDRGAKEEYDCFDLTWGKFLPIMYPDFGNHDGQYFFTYFRDRIDGDKPGYYSRDLTDWHLVFLNTEADMAPQLRWLDDDLRGRKHKWIAACAHRPRFSSGTLNGETKSLSAAWDILDYHGAKLFLSGHDHHYERFEPQDSNGNKKPKGLVQFIAGTGGADQTNYNFVRSPGPNSIIRNNNTWGVIVFHFKPNSYDWEFVPVAGSSFTDSGSAMCE